MGKNKAKAQAQEPEAPEAPAITITDLAGMVTKFADSVGTQIGEMGERLAKLETAPVAAKATSKGNGKAKATVKASIPHSDKLGELKGFCKPVAQSIVEANYRKGAKVMGAYVAKLEGFNTNPEAPSPRLAYARALQAHGWEGKGK